MVQSTVSGTGNIEPGTDVSVNFQTGGTLSQVYVKVGQHVKQGQLLATLDPTAAQLSVDQAEDSVDAADDQLTAAEDGSSSGGGSSGGGGSSSGGGSGSSGGGTSSSIRRLLRHQRNRRLGEPAVRLRRADNGHPDELGRFRFPAAWERVLHHHHDHHYGDRPGVTGARFLGAGLGQRDVEQREVLDGFKRRDIIFVFLLVHPLSGRDRVRRGSDRKC